MDILDELSGVVQALDRAGVPYALASRSRYEALGSELCVIGREALIQLEGWAGRPQDLADVARLAEDDR